MKAKIVVAKCSNGYAGCEAEEIFFYKEDVTTDTIDNDIYTWARENAENYSHVHFGDKEYNEDEFEEYIENYLTSTWKFTTYDEYFEWCEDHSQEPKRKAEILAEVEL